MVTQLATLKGLTVLVAASTGNILYDHDSWYPYANLRIAFVVQQLPIA
jgi:hypothetical protein